MTDNEIKKSDIKVQEYITTLRVQLDEKEHQIEKQQDTIAEQQDKIEHLNEVVSQYKKLLFEEFHQFYL